MAKNRLRTEWFLKLPKTVCLSVDASCGLDEPELISRKELAYPGTFVKVDDNGETQFELPVDEFQLEHWVRTFNQMAHDGIPVPVPIGHTTDPEARRGTVVKMAVEPSEHPNRRGQPALFAYIKWRRPEYKEQFRESDVSLFMPHEFTSGVGKRYARPIRHVAITDYPVVPALSKFSDVAAQLANQSGIELSFIACDHEEGNNMASPALVNLAQKLGVECPEGADDEAISECIEQAFNSAPPGEGEGEGGEGEEEELPEFEEEEEEGELSEAEGMGAGVPPEVFEDEGEGDEFGGGRRNRAHDRNYEPPPAMSFDVPKSLQNRLVKAREQELLGLVTSKKISVPVMKQLKAKYATPKAVSFALSHETMYPNETGDDFDDIVAALSLNSPITSTGERTNHQQSPNHGDNGTPSIVKDAERRAAQHAARHRRNS